MRLWDAAYERLDRPWKRVAFIFWAPLFLVTAAISAYSLLCVYFVYLSNDVDLWFCHRDVAGFTYPSSSPQNDRAVAVAHQRQASRFTTETMAVERSPEFMRCMSKNANGTYWTNYSFAVRAAAPLLVCTAFFALVIFPRFWRSIGGWIAMKS
jgi:hypothetical protein